MVWALAKYSGPAARGLGIRLQNPKLAVTSAGFPANTQGLVKAELEIVTGGADRLIVI
jgi:hypothetical protein